MHADEEHLFFALARKDPQNAGSRLLEINKWAKDVLFEGKDPPRDKLEWTMPQISEYIEKLDEYREALGVPPRIHRRIRRKES